MAVTVMRNLQPLLWMEKTLSMVLPFILQGNRAACFPMHIGIRVDDPCQDTCEDFGFQEESKEVPLFMGVFTSYAYCCQFDVSYYCSQTMTAAGQSPQISFVDAVRHGRPHRIHSQCIHWESGDRGTSPRRKNSAS